MEGVTGSIPVAPTTHSRATRDFLKLREWPAFSGHYVWVLNLCKVVIGLGACFGAFVSGLEIPLPDNGDGHHIETFWRARLQHTRLAHRLIWRQLEAIENIGFR
jgi:hypothetical protein